MSNTRIFLFTALLVAYSATLNAAQISNKTTSNSTQSIESIVNSKSLRVYKSDKRLANNIESTYKVARKGYINKKTVSALLKKIKKNKTFYMFKDWAQDLKNISQTRSLYEIKRLCTKIENKSPTNPVANKLIRNSKDLCFQKYLDKLADRRLGYKALNTEMRYFKKYISYYRSANNTGELNYLLTRYKNSPSRKKLISNTLSSYFVDNNIIPQNKTLQNMYINHELTKFIQLRGMEKNSTRRILYSEYKGLVDEAYEAANANDDARVVGMKVSKAINYYQLSLSHLPLSSSSLKLIGLGKSLMRRSYFDSAQTVFKAVINSSDEYYEDALFEYMWSYITQEDYEGAFEKVVQKYKTHKKYDELTSSKLKFWTAFTMKEENEDGFENILLNIINTDPVSYYSIISSKFLEESSKISSNKKYHNLLKQNERKRIFTDLTVDEYTLRSLKRLKVWSLLDSKTFINSETRALANVYSKELIRKNQDKDEAKIKDFLSFLTAKVIASTDNHLEVFKVVYRGINNKVLTLDGDILDLLYPRPYWKKVQKYSDGLDPYISLSLMRQESAFNRKARSHVGARGLMQLMPYTARRYKSRLRASQLYNVNLNLRLGNKLLNQLMTQYEHNLVYVLSAYNAGEGRVKRWRNKYLTSDSILHNIENIPFSETRKYVKLIFRNIYFYKLMNDESAKVNLADSSKPNKIFDVYLGFNK